MTADAKTIDDLPHFRVSAIKQMETREPYFELSGVFDQLPVEYEGVYSLLVPNEDALIALAGNLEFQDSETVAASFRTPLRTKPQVLGLSLACVPPGWQPRHVWMVTLPTWKWNKTLFHATDATGEVVHGTQVSVVDGEEVKEWIHINEWREWRVVEVLSDPPERKNRLALYRPRRNHQRWMGPCRLRALPRAYQCGESRIRRSKPTLGLRGVLREICGEA